MSEAEAYHCIYPRRKIIASTGIQRRLLNAFKDKIVGLSTVRQWVVRFSSGDGDIETSHVLVISVELLMDSSVGVG